MGKEIEIVIELLHYFSKVLDNHKLKYTLLILGYEDDGLLYQKGITNFDKLGNCYVFHKQIETIINEFPEPIRQSFIDNFYYHIRTGYNPITKELNPHVYNFRKGFIRYE